MRGLDLGEPTERSPVNVLQSTKAAQQMNSLLNHAKQGNLSLHSDPSSRCSQAASMLLPTEHRSFRVASVLKLLSSAYISRDPPPSPLQECHPAFPFICCHNRDEDRDRPSLEDRLLDQR